MAEVTRHEDTIPLRIRTVDIKTNNNAERAIFYEKFLGWKIPSTPYDNIWMEVKVPGESRVNMGLYNKSSSKRDTPVGRVSLTVTVKDLAKFHEVVKDIEGLTVLMEPLKQSWGGFVAAYLSPDDTEISVLEECEYETSPKSAGVSAKASTEDCSKAFEDMKKKTDNGSGICFLEIPCSDEARATKFFTETFGWTFTQCPAATGHFFKPNNDTLPVGGKLTKGIERLKGAVHLCVADMTVAFEKVKANGGSVLKEWSPLPAMNGTKHYTSHIQDTEGNEWGLYHFEGKM